MKDERTKSFANHWKKPTPAREGNCKFDSERRIGSRFRSSLKWPFAEDRSSAGGDRECRHLKRASFCVRQRHLQIMAAAIEAGREKLRPVPDEAERSRCDDQIGAGPMKTTTTTTTVCDNARARAISESNAAANKNSNISPKPPPPPPTGATAVNNTSDDYGNYGEVPTRSARHCHAKSGAGASQNDRNAQHRAVVASKQVFERSLIDPSGCHQSRGDNVRRSTTTTATVLLALAAFFAIVIEPRPLVSGQSLNSDPRPTIYSGQISFGLLLSAHSPPGADISTAASEQTEEVSYLNSSELASVGVAANCSQASNTGGENLASNGTSCSDGSPPGHPTASLDASSNLLRVLRKRQIFERPSEKQVKRQQRQRELELKKQQAAAAKAAKQQSASMVDSACSQVNPDALYAGMGAIWASHQANLVGDSQLAIGTYVYDSCNDLEIGQRQSVRIVSNLNAFQQTTCEAPRGSPISLTIAHGENQLRAIQLLTSFKVPVITTREPFALEDYQLLSRDQRRFLFSTAPSSRYLAAGALKFARRVVARSAASPKLPNQHHKMSSKNGLIVISRNLPEKFIAYLAENIPNQVNYEMIQTSSPIEQVRSVETLERILMQSSASTSGGATTTGSSQSESRVSLVRLANSIERRKRSDDQDQSSGGGSSSDSSDSDSNESGGGDQQHRMLSPTILMFITPAEAMDLITRLRNDLAEVSKYYSLIVTTREDISPALKTIFHKGGSHLCSGKAFHMISPKPDDVSEFSRYFRDTVSMEGESSDHPLICEFSKHQASSRTDSELDDISTEAVIKAVWSAAAAFKLVHKRECAATLGASAPGQLGPSDAVQSQLEQVTTTSTRSTKLQGRRQSQTGNQGKSGAGGSGLTPHAECLVRMNKNMSNLVRNALKKLDVYINSTGLQSLDGFRIKFDDFNELLTNRYSIKYVNKECEITEVGLYSGSNESQLVLDEEVLIKSLESTVPDPWPIPAPPPPPPTPATSAPTVASGKTASADSSGPGGGSTAPNGNQDETSGGSGDESSSPGGTNSKGGSGDDEQESSAQIDNEKQPSTLIENEAPKRKRSNFKLAKRKIQQQELSIKQQPVAMSGDGQAGELSSRLPKGLTDSSSSETSGRAATELPTSRRTTTNGPSFPLVIQPITTATPLGWQPGRKLKPFPSGQSVSLKHWLPREQADIQTASDEPMDKDVRETTTSRPPVARSGPTQLPESDGNTDLDMPAFKPAPTTTSTRRPGQTPPSPQSSARPSSAKSERSSPDKMTTAASTTELSTEAADYVTLPSIARASSHLVLNPIESQVNVDANMRPYLMGNYQQVVNPRREPRFGLLRDLSNPPSLLVNTNSSANNISNGTSRSRLRSHLKWIYSSWFTLTILGANICGALLTLYVLTFLLVKNCDGSLDHGNQGLRSMHLLSVIVVFFGSTLFIVYPTPSLCLLRSSWHNFALVLLFGSLLLQTMQTRSISSIGLGGRPNRLNQMLTLAFMIGVQVASELQRWKYESANYVNFVNQYLNSPEDGDKKLLALSSSIGSQFNPLNSFNDQVTPVSIQVSERYQNLLHDYCSQPVDDFLQSQLYLWIIMSLLVVFSITNRRQMTSQCKTSNAGGAQTTSKSRQGLLTKARGRRDTNKVGAADKTNYALTSGKLLASQHETNEIVGDRLSPLGRCQTFGGSVPFSMGSKAAAKRLHSTTTDVFVVTLISVPIYFVSVVLRVQGQNSLVDDHHDLVASVTMILIALTVLVGIFLPFLRNHDRFGELVSGPVSPTSSTVSAQLDRPMLDSSGRTQTRRRAAAHYGQSSHSSASNNAFAMFPEFASTGLRRPSSIGADSLGRRPFSETKESRRNMGLSLANLPPEPDSLRNLCLHNHRGSSSAQVSQQQQHRAGMPNEVGSEQHTPTSALNLKLAGVDEEPSLLEEHQHHNHQHQIHEPAQVQKSHKPSNNHHHHHHQHRKSQPSASSRRSSISSAGEKRLVMLDVDPCCPRHGQSNGPNPAS